MPLTTDPNDPRLGHGVDSEPVKQSEVYLVLSEEERAKGFVRPVRCTYIHKGLKPKYPLRSLTDDELEQQKEWDYVAYEKYPDDCLPLTGRYWTKRQLDLKACNMSTTMGLALAETYARDPKFYGSTYCVTCGMHRAVAEFVWEDGSVVGS